jgi:hypothetical protein
VSIAIGIADAHDIIVATDTRLTGDDGKLKHDEMHKSSKMSPSLFLAMTGDLEPIRHTFGMIGANLAGVSEDDTFVEFERWCEPRDFTFGLTASMIDDALVLWNSTYNALPRACALLWDWNSGTPRLHLWKKGESGTQVFRDIPRGAHIGEIPEDEGKLKKLIDYGKGTRGAEQRLMAAIQFAADCDPEQRISRRVYIRRYSAGWEPVLISS